MGHKNFTLQSILFILLLTAGIFYTLSIQAQHNNEFYNDGALVHIQAGAELHVLGDVHMTQPTGLLENNGLLKTQGNMYSDALFQQRGTGTTLIENSDVNTTERQFIAGSYAVRGGTSQIGVNDGSFYNLEVNNSQGAVYLINTGAGTTSQYVADVRNTVNFDPQGLGANFATNIVTHDIGPSGALAYPPNGSGYTAEFGMMNTTSGLTNYINDTWHQSGGNNMSTMDKGYVIGKHRRAISPAGGTYGYILGLDPSNPVQNNGNNKGLQYLHFVFGANTYDVLSGYYEAFSPNNTMPPGVECSGYLMNDFWGNRHGEWVFNDINNVAAGGAYEVKIWPQDPVSMWAGTFYTISKDDVFEYPITSPLHNDCGPSPVGLSRNGFNGFSDFGVVSGLILLETRIIDILASPVSNKYIKVDWTTSKELDVDYFVLERSTDDADFIAITTHPAIGNSQVEQSYFIDDHAVIPNINYYYRVKVVNVDGSVDYTHSVVASLYKEGQVETVNLFPNPILDRNATLEITSTVDKNATIFVYDAIGQLMFSKIVVVNKGINTFTLDTKDWPGALYYVHVYSALFSTVKELIKSE
ncbi:MAG: T9SS type A sorting domain-containing protein [Saprospiraceae bacterium]|nr:T9SS type A sorting domain-containing protein [Saprospiraceae bacterium]